MNCYHPEYLQILVDMLETDKFWCIVPSSRNFPYKFTAFLGFNASRHYPLEETTKVYDGPWQAENAVKRQFKLKLYRSLRNNRGSYDRLKFKDLVNFIKNHPKLEEHVPSPL
jgi:hypothetical protein